MARPMAMISATMPSMRSLDFPLVGFRLTLGSGRRRRWRPFGLAALHGLHRTPASRHQADYETSACERWRSRAPDIAPVPLPPSSPMEGGRSALPRRSVAWSVVVGASSDSLRINIMASMPAGGGRVGGCTATAEGTYHWASDWAWGTKDSEQTGSEGWPGDRSH
jgi:hypothetical protein